MQTSNDSGTRAIDAALGKLKENSPHATDGKWLEEIVVSAGPHIKDWNFSECYHWRDWPDREKHFPGSSKIDPGIDVVAVRSDETRVAIQCKARQLDERGCGAPVSKAEMDKFLSVSAHPFWTERWIVINGRIEPSPQLDSAMALQENTPKWINMARDLQDQSADADESETSGQSESDPNGVQSKNSMQREAVENSVRILKEHAQSDSGGLPVGQARGKIILPCGTGKTRISLRIVEELTAQGELSIILCPSIALVAQIRREYLQHRNVEMRALAVCSDQTAGYDPKKEDRVVANEDPTIDRSNVSASEVKGKVTTDPKEIAEWIIDSAGANAVNVIFGTYQSGHRIADALGQTGTEAKVLIADEAHRTAGLKRRRGKSASEAEKRLRDFTLCHDNDAFPATYRVYQTATPRVYNTSKRTSKDSDYIVRSMDDETVFGVELYRKSYVEAVNNEWLSDYRIIALAINDRDAYEEANKLAKNTKSVGRRKLSSYDYMRGLAFALAMGGAAQAASEDDIKIESCIAFMNTVDKSKNMAADLQSETVKRWVQKWLDEDNAKRQTQKRQTVSNYSLEHLDATSNVTARDHAKYMLATASEQKPYGIVNVGIFGEGTDSPSLNAVAFLEPRRSPIDVIQAVGRAMRKADNKEFGYIVCPVVIPPNVDAEQWLSISEKDEGWREMAQILLALRAHDQRIEEELAKLMYLYIPPPPEEIRALVAVAMDNMSIQYREHQGKQGEAELAVKRVLEGTSALSEEFSAIKEEKSSQEFSVNEKSPQKTEQIQFSIIVAGKKNSDGSTKIRINSIQRDKPKQDGTPGNVNIEKSKKKAGNMINRGEGRSVSPGERKPGKKRTKNEIMEANAQRMMKLSGMDVHGNAIRMNLLTKSGLRRNRVLRDLNILEESVKEARYHLQSDDLSDMLDRHFGLDQLKTAPGKTSADGCTIAALLMMNAAMLHQRISNGGWLPEISSLSEIKSHVRVVHRMSREWERIMRHDFETVLEPPLEAIYAVEDTGKMAGLERALRHIAAEAERIAETYADMGADHAGALFNSVMGNQASDGAFFTRPAAASIAARLTLDACGDADWTNLEVWREHKTVDLACGSGTLLTAMLTDMKRRAREQGAGEYEIAALQRIAVEETIKGLDINPVSLQLAAAQLTAGNQYIRYSKMGLHRMPYGPQHDGTDAAGTLELLSQKAILPRPGELNIPDIRIESEEVWKHDDAQLEKPVEAVKNSRIVIMNPPFTNRTKMGEKFATEIQKRLRERADAMESILVKADPALQGLDKNSIEPLFVALADLCADDDNSSITLINPTIALTATSAQRKREILAQRCHIHTIVTSHDPKQINMSQNTSINESVIIAKRHKGTKPPTRFVNLDKFPVDDVEVADLHESILAANEQGEIPNGWGAISYWPADRIETGDWTPAIWRSPKLADAARQFATNPNMLTIQRHGFSCWKTSAINKRDFIPATFDTPWNFPLIDSKGANGQKTIRSVPDAEWQPARLDEERRILNGGTYPEVDKLLNKAGYLLITSGQDTSTARLTAIASDEKYVGRAFLPVVGPSVRQAKAIAVFINSTAGRLQLLRNAGRKLSFPLYNPAPLESIRIPDIEDARILRILSACWEATKDAPVPQFRDGECDVRVLWDEAVAAALGWDRSELSRLRLLLHQEPHVRGLGYNQYADAAEADE